MSSPPVDSRVAARPLVLHVMFRFDTGGLENGIVNLINHMPETAYRHAVLALTEVTGFRDRIKRTDVEFIALHKPPGHALRLYPKLFQLFRSLRPAIVHSRNLAALEVQVPAWAARVPVRVHGEHGREIGDLDGSNLKYRRVRRAYRPFVHHYLALSRDLAADLGNHVGVTPERLTQVYNGVDSLRFHPASDGPAAIPGCPFASPEHFLVGTVGRMQPVKDQLMLARAFVTALAMHPELRPRLRLVMVGDGPLRAASMGVLDAAGAAHLAWLPGERSDVPDVMRGLDCFVLPSLAEGISNTILEAMATGLAVVATRVGGNADLVIAGKTGELVPPADFETLARSLARLALTPDLARAMGRAGRLEAEQRFSMQAMVAAYQSLYDRLLQKPQRS